MKRLTATGKTVEDAITSALVRLGTTRSQVQVRVIHEPVKGIFGFLGGKDAEVEVTLNLSPQEEAKQFLTDVLFRMGVPAVVRVRKADTAVVDVAAASRQARQGGTSGGSVGATQAEVVAAVAAENPSYVLEVVCEDEAQLAAVIGRHGAVLDSLQYLVNIVSNRDLAGFTKFTVDAGGYRERRRRGLERMADQAANRAVRTRRPVSLEAMPSGDRRVIHTRLQSRSDVTTSSEGVDPNRKVVVTPVRGGTRSRRPRGS